MTKPKYTPEGLYVVTQEVIDVFNRDLSKRHSEGLDSQIDFHQEFGERILKEDKDAGTFFALIDYIMEDDPENLDEDFEEINGRNLDAYMLNGAAFMYEILRRQAETYKMEGYQISDPEKKTKSGLYILDEDTIGIFFRDFQQRIYEGQESLSSFEDEILRRISSDNPHLYGYFRERIEQGNLEQVIFFQGAAFMYEILRRQAEANQLEKTIKQDGKNRI
jgi:hypothetical protein